MATISSSTVDGIKASIDNFVKDPTNAPGVVYSAINRNGDLLFNHAAGTVGAGRSEPMTTDSVMWIASCTKMITGIACMQQVEQGKMELDSVEFVERVAPELKAVKVIENGQLVDKKQGITLRMLLSHTAGFGYSFFNKNLNDYYGASGVNELSGHRYDYMSQPLVNQPGSRWEYGINIDWAGVLLERVTGQTLNDYMQDHIFKPMGITDISMFPTAKSKKNLAFMNSRAQDGTLGLNSDGHLHQRPLSISDDPEERKNVFNSGGAGCFAIPSQYCEILAMFLNDGIHPKTGAQILKKETVDQMFSNQIPGFPDFGFQGIEPTKRHLSYPLPAVFPDEPGTPQGWGLTFFLHTQQGAYHSPGTGWWCGLANVFWWCDRKAGVAGIVGSQIIPFGDPKVMGLWIEVEGQIYQNLQPPQQQ